MNDQSEPLTTEIHSAARLSHKRILLLMAIICVVVAFLGLIFKGSMFGIGVLFGGAMAFANYFWQESSTRAIFAVAAGGSKPFFPALRYVLRYLVIGGVIWLVYITDAFPIVAVIMGLAAFTFAVMAEAFVSILFRPDRKGS